MSSVISSKAVIPPFKRYIATGSAQLVNDAGTNSITVAAGVTLVDMGKTVQLDTGVLLRKVCVGADDSKVAYIKLDGTNATQNIVRLN